MLFIFPHGRNHPNETLLLNSAFVRIFSAPSCPSADEGMWLYNAAPKDKIKAKYGFELTQEWLDHVRLSSVRFNNGGSGSFVSADGLTFTNHHVGAACVQQLSTEGHDYIKTGFYAKTQAEEAKCPNLELNQLVGIEDVTAKVNAGVKPGMSAAEAGQAQRAAMSEVEKECSSSTGLRCDVVIFYSGAGLQPLQVQEVHRRAPGVRAGVRHRLLRRRSRQLHLSAVRPRHHVLPRL